MLRKPIVADKFYPGDPAELKKFLDDTMGGTPKTQPKKGLAIVSPHAGYIYSGTVAAETISAVNVPETVIIIGPNHHGRGAALAVGTDDWSMPLGTVPVEKELAAKIMMHSPVFVHDETAHLAEHSLEVQIPFLQHAQEELSIVPIVASRISYSSCQEAAADLSRAITGFNKPVLLVASTDMTHYESRAEATLKDRLALQKIEQLDPAGLYQTVSEQNISMCGVIPTVIILLTAILQGANKVELVSYTDSGAVSGDTSQVVGYAGLIVS